MTILKCRDGVRGPIQLLPTCVQGYIPLARTFERGRPLSYKSYYLNQAGLGPHECSRAEPSHISKENRALTVGNDMKLLVIYYEVNLLT